ncbi:MAG: hypothetical protein LBT40_18520 [Deltaproteobacteria bacterium]|jgi:hypothetical protein|nr:hypothetical protein [Deltaproteobacteria bacterium]
MTQVKKFLSAERITLGLYDTGTRLLARRSQEELGVMKRMADGDAPSPKTAVRAVAPVAVLDGQTMSGAGTLSACSKGG